MKNKTQSRQLVLVRRSWCWLVFASPARYVNGLRGIEDQQEAVQRGAGQGGKGVGS